jgi:hypothetical protein
MGTSGGEEYEEKIENRKGEKKETGDAEAEREWEKRLK